jgi:hypothetical protein
VTDFNVKIEHEEEPQRWGSILLIIAIYFGVLVPLVGWWVTIGIFVCCWLINWLQHIAQEADVTGEEEA